MTTFTVWKFDDPDGAERGSEILKDCAREGLIKILDHAIVSWPEGAKQPTSKHSHDDTRHGAGWGALWGVVAGSLFLVPVVGGVAGAAIGAYSKMTQDAGISKEQLETIRTKVTPGSSALFVVTDEADLDKVGDRFRVHSTLIATNLTPAEREVLLETFGH